MATLTWHGHATWTVRTGGHTLLVDPFFTGNPAANQTAHQANADVILVTHGHEDHTADLVEIARRTGAAVVCNWEISEWLRGQGIDNTVPMNIGGTVKFDWGTAKMTPALHSSSWPDGTYAGNPCGYLLTLTENKTTIYFAGDTALFGDMTLIGRGGIDVAVLPIGDVYTMGVEDSLVAIDLLKAKKVLPSHYNTWPPIAVDANHWATRVGHEANAQPIVPRVGEGVEV
ncbi:MAG: metal-dependent hydrolase [Pirellulales bacterium]|nr:metal-dependent hydrolase [Pirellulales bacterium]